MAEMSELDTLKSEMEKAKQVEADAMVALGTHSGPDISVINQSTVVSDSDVAGVVAALQVQI